MEIKIKRLRDSAIIPTQKYSGDAGFDLYSTERIVIKPFERKIVPTGIAIQVPSGYYARIAPRSGLAVKNGIQVMAGVIDKSYTGEIGVVLLNCSILGSEINPRIETVLLGGVNDFVINPGDRIAQIIFEKIADDVSFTEVNDLDKTDRGSGGYGSTGK